MLRSRVRTKWRGTVGSSTFTPLSGANVDMYFANGQYFGATTADLTVTRASTAYGEYLGGSFQSFGSNVARITDKGLLAEESRTNLVLQNTFQTIGGVWTATNCTTSQNAGVSPDGASTALQLTENAGTGDKSLVSNVITASVATYTQKWYVKRASGTRNVELRYFDATSFTNYALIDFNLDTLGTSLAGSNGGFTYVSSACRLLGSGWYEITATAQVTSTVSVPNFQVYLLFLNASNATNYTGDGTSGFMLWAPQCEVGAFATTPIITVGATVTRAADVIVPGAALTGVVAAATGTVLAQTNYGVAGITSDVYDSNGAIHLGFTSGNAATTQVTSTTSTANTATRTARTKLAVAWNAGGRAICLNGGTVATDAVAVTPSATEWVGSTSGTSNFLNGYIERLTLYNTKQSNGNLQTLTT